MLRQNHPPATISLTPFFSYVHFCMALVRAIFVQQVLWASFSSMNLTRGSPSRVLLLAYNNGFQIWDVSVAKNVREVVSRRDGCTASLHVLPRVHDRHALLAAHEPVVCVVCQPTPSVKAAEFLNQAADDYGNAYIGHGMMWQQTGVWMENQEVCEEEGLREQEEQEVTTQLRLYSLRSSSYIHSFTVAGAVMAVRCSARVLAVAVSEQVSN